MCDCRHNQEVEGFYHSRKQAGLLPSTAPQAALAVILQMTKWRLGEVVVLPKIAQSVSDRSETRTFIMCLLVQLPAECRLRNLQSTTLIGWGCGDWEPVALRWSLRNPLTSHCSHGYLTQHPPFQSS